MLDEIDRKLILLLSDNALQSSRVLADKLNVSPATVRRRLKKLLERKMLRIVGAIADPRTIGMHLAVLIAFDVALDKVDAVAARLSSDIRVTWLSTTTGRYDIMALVRFASTEELNRFLNAELSTVEGVTNSETFICLDVKKVRYMPITD